MSAQFESQGLRVSFSRWLNSFIICTYKCELKEGHIDDLESPLKWESFSEISIFPLSLLAEKCKNNPDEEQSIVLDRIKYTEYIPVAAIVDIHGVKPPKLEFFLGKKNITLLLFLRTPLQRQKLDLPEP